jgi:polar amino acid transport system permease protein
MQDSPSIGDGMGYQLDFGSVLAGEYAYWIASGLFVTAVLSISAWLLAFCMAVVLVVLRMSGFRAAEWFVVGYVEYHQNVPLLVQILFWYFGIPELLPAPVKTWINEGNTEFILALLAISFCFSAYMSEALRSSIRAIPKTQFEASRALGLGYLRTMWFVVLPQAVRMAMPPLMNITLLLFKNSSLAMVIGVHELTYKMQQINNETFHTFEIFGIATLIYLSISLLIMWAGEVCERRMHIS